MDELLALKASAKSSRDDELWEEAIDDLQEAIGLLDVYLSESGTPLPSWLASELADTYGILGGVEKRWALTLTGPDRQLHLKRSVAAYDHGFRYEKGLGPNDASTYNRINRLVGRVLLDPHILVAEDDGTFDIADELAEAETILTDQLHRMRQKDPWAYCDLGAIRLLQGEKDALSPFYELDRLRPPAFVYEGALATMEPLSEVASSVRPDLTQAVELLRRSAWSAGQRLDR